MRRKANPERLTDHYQKRPRFELFTSDFYTFSEAKQFYTKHPRRNRERRVGRKPFHPKLKQNRWKIKRDKLKRKHWRKKKNKLLKKWRKELTTQKQPQILDMMEKVKNSGFVLKSFEKKTIFCFFVDESEWSGGANRERMAKTNFNNV